MKKHKQGYLHPRAFWFCWSAHICDIKINEKAFINQALNKTLTNKKQPLALAAGSTRALSVCQRSLP